VGSFVAVTAADGHPLEAYRSEPEGKPKGAIVVVQEIFGVNGHIRDVTDGFAAAGWLAIAPALFDRVEAGVELGYDAEGVAKGRPIAMGLSLDDQVLVDVAAAAAAVRSAGLVGVVGYCYGGMIAAAAACRLGGVIDAAVGYYGGRIRQLLGHEVPVVPLQLHFGLLDQGIPVEDVDAIDQAWPAVEVHRYDGAGHGFNCDRRDSFAPEASALARARTLIFFDRYLAGDMD
jgi:carboxymethylenebutenolidase